MSQIAPPGPSAKTAFFLTVGVSAVFGMVIFFSSRPSTRIKSHGYSIRGHNYSKCNCNE